MVGKTTLIVVLCVLGTSLAAEVGAGVADKFKQHLVDSPNREFVSRTRIFADNLRRIDELNAQHNPHTQFGTNKFSHLSFNEFIAKYASGYTPSLANYTSPVHVWDAKAAPQTRDDVQVDWRAQGKVTGVKDQGQLGSCTAFGVNSAIESVFAIKRNYLTNLSEQQIVDCVDDYNFMNEFGYASITGLVNDQAYPYHASRGTCSIPDGYRVKTDGVMVLSENKEDDIESVLRTYGPMAVAIHVNDAFMYYSSGILTTGDCNDNWHAVAVVGLGRDNDQDYWIIKNSWGTGWGEKGYIRLRRKQNTCDIEHEPVTAWVP